ncbi:hypothetical protein ACLB1M_05205 [Escherichia coli]
MSTGTLNAATRFARVKALMLEAAVAISRHRVNNISSDNNQDVLKRITGGINKFELNDNKNIICL